MRSGSFRLAIRRHWLWESRRRCPMPLMTSDYATCWVRVDGTHCHGLHTADGTTPPCAPVSEPMKLRRIGAAYGSSFLGFVTALLSSLWLLRLVDESEGQAAFGLLALVTQIAWYLGLLQCGLDAAASQR